MTAMKDKDDISPLDFNEEQELVTARTHLYFPGTFRVIPRTCEPTRATLMKFDFAASHFSVSPIPRAVKFTANLANLAAPVHAQAVADYRSSKGRVQHCRPGATADDPTLVKTLLASPRTLRAYQEDARRFRGPCLAAGGTLPATGPRG